MTTVVLLRHGRTSANASGVLAGRSSGVELDPHGREQALATAGRLAGVELAAVVTSPLRRCRQTASALLRDQPGRELHVDAGLTECGYGAWTGRKLSELARDPLWKTVQSQPSAVRFPDGESMMEMQARALGTIHAWDSKLTAGHGDCAVWVAVSHGDVIKAILAAALGMHLDAFQRIVVDPASISVVHYGEARPHVLTVNNSGALALPGRPGQAATVGGSTGTA